MEILERWICQIMTFPRVNSVFSFIFSEIPEVLLLKILFSPSFSVKFQRVFLLKILFFSPFPVKSQRFFCSKFKFSKKSRQKSHKSWPKSMNVLAMTILTQCHDKVSPKKTLEIQCSACKASFEKSPESCKWGQNVCFSQQLETVKIEFWHEFEQKKGNCQTCKHSISLTFIYFYYPKLDILQQYSSIVVQFPQNETFFKGFHPLCPPNAIHLFNFLATKMRLFEGFSSTVHTWNEEKNTLENFQLLWSWNETIWEDFHPQWSLNNP